jgi:retron-type reverse transcriptase
MKEWGIVHHGANARWLAQAPGGTMKRYGHLFEKVLAFDNLLLAAHKARHGKQDRISVARFFFHLEPELLTLQAELQSGAYRMRPYRTFAIYEPKRRQICAADLRDWVVHHAICHVLDPLFEASMIADTYACRRGKGTHAAVHRMQALARKMQYFLKGDVRKYFETVDRAVLKALLRRKLKDQALLVLLEHIIDHPIPGGVPGKGIPIGNLTSQYFANLYLGELDHFLKERLRLKGYVRYMDDLLVLSANKPCLHETLQHPDLVAYADLPETEKTYDRNAAMETLKAVLALGYRIDTCPDAPSPTTGRQGDGAR